MAAEKSAVVAPRAGRSTSEGLKKIRFGDAAAGSPAFAVDSLLPQFRFPNVAVRSSGVDSVTAAQNALRESIAVHGQAREPHAATWG